MKTLFLFLCVILASCASKSGNPKIRIATLGPGLQPHLLAIPLAQAFGYFQQEGLDVSTETLPSTAKTMQALMGGSADTAIIGYLQTIQMAAEGQKVRVFYSIARRSNSVLVLAPGSRSVSEIKSVLRRINNLRGFYNCQLSVSC